jgi:hypothetical protein
MRGDIYSQSHHGPVKRTDWQKGVQHFEMKLYDKMVALEDNLNLYGINSNIKFESDLEIHKIKLILNKEEFPHQWKESVVVPIYKKGDKTDCSNY